MITVTITLKSTAHQIVLMYQSEETRAAAKATSKRDGGMTTLYDDYGHASTYVDTDIASVFVTDLAPHWKGENAKAMHKMRADRDLKEEVVRSTDLTFLVEDRKPFFGR